MNDVRTRATEPLGAALRRLAHLALRRVEEVIDDLPAIVRRIRTLLIVASVSVTLIVLVGVAFVLHRVF